jgi:PAS domain S-box-containing protein
MKTGENKMPKEISELRIRAEQKAAQSPENIDALLPDEVKRILHELRVHQIELEMQNEELRTSQVELESARARYFDLYNLAPVGYFTISEQGLILEANLTAAVMLDVHLGALLGRPFSQFILKTDQDIYYLHRKQLLESGEMQAFELRILKQDGSSFWAQLDTTVTEIDDGASVIRVVISDISERKKAEEELRASEELTIQTLHALPANIAVIDREGQIIAVNRAWTEFSNRNRPVEALDDSLGGNYLDVCRQSIAGKDADAVLALGGIEAVLAGARGQFTHEYPCHSLKEQHWFLMNVVPLGVGGKGGAVIFHFDITERKLEEEKIKRTATRLSLATHAGGVGIWDYDPVNKRFVWDEQMFRLYGTASDKFSGAYDDWQEGVHPEDRRRGDDEIRLALSGEKEFNTEFRVLWPDGAVRNIRAQAIVQRDAAGQPVHMIGINWDITVQKQAEAVLNSSKTKLELALQSAIMGVWQFNVVEDKRVFDNQVCSLLGIDPATFGGTAAEFFAAVHPDDREKLQSALIQSIERDLPYAPEYRVVRENGSIHHICTRGRIIRDDMGRALMINGVLWDITDHRRTEEALREKEERYRRLVEMSPEAILVNSETEVIFANNAALRLFGASSPGELTGKSPLALYHPDYHPLLQERIGHLIEGHSVPLVETRALRLDGTIIDVEVVASPFSEKGVRIIQVLVRDITERKKAEAVLKRDKKALKILVRKKSVKLMENQMELESSKRLSDIGTLAATVAHELRNPLSGISLAAAVIKRKNADNTVERQLQRIDSMVAESGQIIDNLLFYSRLKPKHRKTLDVHSLLEECMEILQQVHIGKNIVITKHIAALKNVTICADPGQIREVFANILNNSADAVPDHGGEIDVKARIYHRLIKIHITDNGNGIAKEDLKRVFDPFFTTKAKGTGLGLTVCMQIVKMHGGFINIKNRNEKGTSLIITLPLGEPKKGYGI